MLQNVFINRIEKIKVLHIDDDPSQFDFIRHFLSQSEPDIILTCIEDPSETLKQLEKEEYHVVVTDYNMPKMNGIELATKIRKKYSIPIILYTGQGSEEVAERAFSIGIDDYLRKEMDPSHYAVLAKRIRNVVDKKQLEQLHVNILDQTHFGVCIFIGEVIQFANKAAIGLFEKKNINDLLGTNPFSSIVSEYGIYLEPGEHTLEIERKKGKSIFLEVSSKSISYYGEEAILTFIWDITDKKRVETEKALLNVRFKSLVELSPDGIATFNTAGYMTFLNGAFSRLTGFNKKELLGSHLLELQTVRKRDLFKYFKHFPAIIRGEEFHSIEFNYQKKDGKPGVGESYVDFIDINGTKEVLLIARDITEKKTNEKRYNLLFNKNQDGLIEISNDNKIINVNNEFVKKIGLEENKIIDKNICDLDIFSKNTKEKIQAMIKRVKRNKHSLDTELIIKTIDKKELWANVRINPIVFDKEILGYQLTIKENTTRVEATETQKYAKRLEQLVELKTKEIINNERLVAAGRTASMIGHDIRTPLQNIKNCLYIINKNNIYDKEIINKIDDQLNYCESLLHRFENKIKSDYSNLKYISIEDYIENIISIFEYKENIEISTIISPNIPLIKIDELQMKRVLMNILNNSVEAMPDGGQIIITGEIKDGELELGISDTGIGIPQDKLEKIFDTFYTTKKDGIGLGLSFCKNVVNEHGGIIEVISEENVGTTLTIRLPVDTNYKDIIEIPTPELEMEN